MNPLFDSTHLILALRNQADYVRSLRLAAQSFGTVYTSAMNVGEVYGGMRSGEEEKTAQLIESLTVFASHYGDRSPRGAFES